MCGFVQSIFTTVPDTVTGCALSYSAANEWWAVTEDAVSSSPTAMMPVRFIPAHSFPGTGDPARGALMLHRYTDVAKMTRAQGPVRRVESAANDHLQAGTVEQGCAGQYRHRKSYHSR